MLAEVSQTSDSRHYPVSTLQTEDKCRRRMTI
jgi:hypothetical protein